MKPTKANLEKLEEVFEKLGYRVRYEKGNFASGYCLLKSTKVLVINKFLPTEGRFTVLLDLLKELKNDKNLFGEGDVQFLSEIFS